jgi:hypothetical protein
MEEKMKARVTAGQKELEDFKKKSAELEAEEKRKKENAKKKKNQKPKTSSKKKGVKKV